MKIQVQLHQPGRPQRWSRVLCDSQATRSQTTLLWRQNCKVFFSIYLYLFHVYNYYEVCKRLNEYIAQLDPVTGKSSSLPSPSPWYWPSLSRSPETNISLGNSDGDIATARWQFVGFCQTDAVTVKPTCDGQLVELMNVYCKIGHNRTPCFT